MDEYYRAIRLLPSWLAGPLGQLPAQTAAQIHELRFRTGCGVFVTLSGRQLPLQDLPECPLQLRECVLDQFQIEEIFHTLCGGAVHAHQTELAHGFLTTPSGCRVGVAGRYVDRDGQTVLQQVQGLNLRIARAVPVQLPDELLVQLKKHFIGMLGRRAGQRQDDAAASDRTRTGRDATASLRGGRALRDLSAG